MYRWVHGHPADCEVLRYRRCKITPNLQPQLPGSTVVMRCFCWNSQCDDLSIQANHPLWSHLSRSLFFCFFVFQMQFCKPQTCFHILFYIEKALHTSLPNKHDLFPLFLIILLWILTCFRKQESKLFGNGSMNIFRLICSNISQRPSLISFPLSTPKCSIPATCQNISFYRGHNSWRCVH